MTSDDEDILKFLIEDKRYKYYKGNRVWKMAEDLKVSRKCYDCIIRHPRKCIFL